MISYKYVGDEYYYTTSTLDCPKEPKHLGTGFSIPNPGKFSAQYALIRVQPALFWSFQNC